MAFEPKDRTAILVTAWPGQLGWVDLERLAAKGERPRTDYVELGRALDSDIIDWHWLAERRILRLGRHASRFGLIGAAAAAALLHRPSYSHIVAWSDQIGLSLAFLMKLTRAQRDVVMISSLLTSRRRLTLMRDLAVHTYLRSILCASRMQIEIATTTLGVPREKLHLRHAPVDENFWRPVDRAPVNTICSVGREDRDYSTLLHAIEGLPLELELVVGSKVPFVLPQELGRAGMPRNATIRQNLSYHELRELYARSRFVVIPLRDVDNPSGITAIAEAMAMGKAVIATRIRGKTEYVRDGENGLYVPPGDQRAMRAAIAYLAENPAEAARMGRAGRSFVEAHLTLDKFVANLAGIIRTSAMARATSA